MKRTVLILLLVALLTGCAVRRSESAARVEEATSASVAVGAICATATDARLDAVEITVADTTVRIGSVTLARRRVTRQELTADTVATSVTDTQTRSLSEPPARSSPLLWLVAALLIAVAVLLKIK